MPVNTPQIIIDNFDDFSSRDGDIEQEEIAELLTSEAGPVLIEYVKALKSELAALSRYDHYTLTTFSEVFDGWPVKRSEDNYNGAVASWRTFRGGPSELNRTVYVFDGEEGFRAEKYKPHHDSHGKYLVVMESYGRIGFSSKETESLGDFKVGKGDYSFGATSDREVYKSRRRPSLFDVPGTWYHWSFFCDTIEEAEEAARLFVPTRKTPMGSKLHHWVH